MYFVLQKNENNYFVLIFFQKKKKAIRSTVKIAFGTAYYQKKKKMIIIKNQKYNVKLMPMNLSKMKQKKILHYPFLELRNK